MRLLHFVDYAAAYPSVHHEWISVVLKAIEAPAGFVNIVKAMYHDAEAHMVVPGQLQGLASALAFNRVVVAAIGGDPVENELGVRIGDEKEPQPEHRRRQLEPVGREGG